MASGFGWRVAEVTERVQETASACTLVLDAPGWPGHRAGQHVDVRLTAEDGYHNHGDPWKEQRYWSD